MSLNATSIVFKQSKTWNQAWTSFWRFSLFRENRLVSVLSWCYENQIDSLIYEFFWAGDNQSGYQKKFKLTQFSDKSVLVYIYIQQQPVFKTWLLNFSLIKISFNNLITSSHQKSNIMWEKQQQHEKNKSNEKKAMGKKYNSNKEKSNSSMRNKVIATGEE